ncbi:hypothetical protein [Sphingomonas sp. URHD0057]|uniref:hypothetical protein n=1 Tax=Sphingomonas sp. URHD0057 TaxID=1380389 RepID=UPI00048ABEA9|nr:hypothetical protein [Sphingomonas sp. URHD0057]
MPPHNAVVTIRPRSLSNVLLDLKEAKRDYDDALGDEHEDRATEAETRLTDLQSEFDVRLAESTGLSVEDFRAAYSEALI